MIDGAAEIVEQPLADGGEGSLGLLEKFWSLERVQVSSFDPLLRPVTTSYLRKGDKAFVELAATAGLVLLDEGDRNPMDTTTYGTGIVIGKTIDDGCRDVRLFIGGSATNDAAMGIARALGYQFLDKLGDDLAPVGRNLDKVDQIKFNSRSSLFDQVSFSVVCDVVNPFAGPNGAAYVYAGQKGASSEMIESLDYGLEHFAGKLKENGYADILNTKGAGAAGGVGGGMVALMKADLIPGIDMFFELFEIRQKVSEADIVVTGEGSFDDQSFQGKVVGKVCEVCAVVSKKCYVVCGVDMRSGARNDTDGLAKVYPITEVSTGIEDAKSNARQYVLSLGKQIAQGALKKKYE